MNKLNYFLFLCIVLVACTPNDKNKVPDISKINARVIEVVRFDKELFSIDTNKMVEQLNSLLLKYPAFSRIYFQDIMKLTDNLDSVKENFYQDVKLLVGDQFLQKIIHRSDSLYGDWADLRDQFQKTATYIKYYFPTARPVNIYTFISVFNVGNIIFEINDTTDGLGISLDFFQGNDFDYKSINPNYELFANYVTRSFNKDHLLKKSWTPWMDDLVSNKKDVTLLDHMITEGKKLYILERVIPEIQDTVLFEFTADQLKWCKSNALDIWTFLKDQNLVNSSKRNDIIRLMNPAPFSAGMPRESPGRAAAYIGYEIVRDYMHNHSEKSLSDLVLQESAQVILDEAKYKPSNK